MNYKILSSFCFFIGLINLIDCTNVSNIIINGKEDPVKIDRITFKKGVMTKNLTSHDQITCHYNNNDFCTRYYLKTVNCQRRKNNFVCESPELPLLITFKNGIVICAGRPSATPSGSILYFKDTCYFDYRLEINYIYIGFIIVLIISTIIAIAGLVNSYLKKRKFLQRHQIPYNYF